MIELALVLISFIFGVTSYISYRISKNNTILFAILILLNTLLFIYITYILYNGKISLILKISIITGFILCKVIEKNVKFHKILLKKIKTQISVGVTIISFATYYKKFI